MRRTLLLVLTALLGVPASSWAAPQRNAGPGPQNEFEAARRRGALLFQIHCASCHGLEGRGDGPLAGDLEVEPSSLADLTERTEAGGSRFPVGRLAAVIDGRELPGAHGKRQMPVWGLTFQDASRDSNQEQAVTDKIHDLIEHLRTLQGPDAADPKQSDGAD